MIDHAVFYDNAIGDGTFEELVTGISGFSYTATGLTQGSTYQFKVKVRNAYGFSFFSNVITVLAAQVPAQPVAPVTTWHGDGFDYVVVTWTAPDDGGSPITGYKLTLKQKDLVYSSDLTHCDMSSSTLTTCTLPVTALRSTPFLLEWGDSVFAKVIATNLYGDSVESVEGNGAYITINPDPPTSLVEDYSQRTKSTLGLVWTAPTFTGGDVILDYKINYRVFGGVF